MNLISHHCGSKGLVVVEKEGCGAALLDSLGRLSLRFFLFSCAHHGDWHGWSGGACFYFYSDGECFGFYLWW